MAEDSSENALMESMDEIVDEIVSLSRRVDEGDESARPKLRELLDANPAVWQHFGDLANHARRSMMLAIAGESVLLRESISRQAQEMEYQLMGPNPTQLEKLAVQRVVACWLEMQWVDALNPLPQGEYLPQAKFNLRLKESAQHRYHAAMKSLLLVRKMEKRQKSKASGAVPSNMSAKNGVAANGPKGPRDSATSSNGHASESAAELVTAGATSNNAHGSAPWANRVKGLFGEDGWGRTL